MICSTPKPFCLQYTKQKEKKNDQKRDFLRKGWVKDWTKTKEIFLTALAAMIKLDPITSRKQKFTRNCADSN